MFIKYYDWDLQDDVLINLANVVTIFKNYEGNAVFQIVTGNAITSLLPYEDVYQMLIRKGEIINGQY